MNFYFEAARVLDHLDAKQGSVQSLIGTLPEKSRKRTAALVLETLKYKSVLLEVINEAKLMKEERKKLTSVNLALVLVHDLLLCNGVQAGDGPIKQAILRNKTRLNAELQKIKIKRGATANKDLVETNAHANIPRYVRVNTLFWSTEEAKQCFLARGLVLGPPLDQSNSFDVDIHIPDLLLFHPQTTLVDDPLYKSGKLILQDKASCMPALVLSPPARDDTVVIDATAAPGNKTSHLSALMGNRGKVYAFEKDRKRFSTLTMMLLRAGCTNVEPCNADFLAIDPADPRFSKVTHILLDPSCSGSGIVNRLDHLLQNGSDDQDAQLHRLKKLAAFQLMMIKHAMKFPRVQKIVYSTCSIHATENEHVVRAALNSDEGLTRGFKLAPPHLVLPKWDRRGLPLELDNPDDAASLIRCLPADGTNGFFVSCFSKAQGYKRRRTGGIDEQSLEPAEESHTRQRKKKKLEAISHTRDEH